MEENYDGSFSFPEINKQGQDISAPAKLDRIHQLELGIEKLRKNNKERKVLEKELKQLQLDYNSFVKRICF